MDEGGIMKKLSFLVMLFTTKEIFPAVGCTLNDPDRDIKRIFPNATRYTTQFITIKEKGGDSLRIEIENKLGEKLDKKYEALDVPYAYYTVYKGDTIIGRVHGLNQKGMFGGMQIILATDTTGKIIEFYYQKLSSPVAKEFKSKDFRKQFIEITLKDFYHHDLMLIKGIKNCPADKIPKIKSPTKKYYKDFEYTLRGIKKNLILLDIFILNRKYDKFYKILQKKDKK
jgi:hypothetical protein